MPPLPHHLRSQLAKRCDVVHDPNAASMSRQHEVRFARMHHDVADGYGWKLMALVLRPVLSAIQGNPQAKFCAEIEEIPGNGILFDHVRIAANAAIGCDHGRPGLAVIGCFVDVRLHVPKGMAGGGGLKGGRPIKTPPPPTKPREHWLNRPTC